MDPMNIAIKFRFSYHVNFICVLALGREDSESQAGLLHTFYRQDCKNRTEIIYSRFIVKCLCYEININIDFNKSISYIKQSCHNQMKSLKISIS